MPMEESDEKTTGDTPRADGDLKKEGRARKDDSI